MCAGFFFFALSSFIARVIVEITFLLPSFSISHISDFKSINDSFGMKKKIRDRMMKKTLFVFVCY